MRVVILDLDGVMCINGTTFESYAVKNLITILDKSNAKIVLSSSWRLSNDWKPWIIRSIPVDLDKSWVDLIIDTTPVIGGWEEEIRVSEIKQWLSKNPVDNYVVIDDMDLKMDNFVRTKFERGLDSRIMNRVLKVLGY